MNNTGTGLGEWFRAESPTRPIIASPTARIFLISFALLFFELLCIRWIPSYVRYLSYFTNFILLASFLGMGLGILSARRPKFWFPPFPLWFLALALVVWWNKFDLKITSTQVLYYGVGENEGARTENYLVVPAIFALVTAAFIPLARPLGLLLKEVKPLTAYTADIIGSLAGTATFFAIAWFALPPAAWFGLLVVPLLLLADKRILPTAGTVVFLASSLGVATYLQRDAVWSPYYKIVLHKLEVPATWKGPMEYGYLVDVNNAGGHQSMMPWRDKEPFYRRVYEIFPGSSFDKAMIIGAGSGSDVATALANGVKSVTAVEIDPKIQELGAAHNPDQPYQDPRVKVVINDGRAHLRNETEKYDLIIFALPDSLTLTSSVTSLRLESFLLTQDAIASARERLTDNGVLVLYNYYREEWLVAKLAGMVSRVFEADPIVSTYGGWGRAAVIMAGPRVAALPKGQFGVYKEIPGDGSQGLRVIGEGFYPLGDTPPARDDWPFLYLRNKTFPGLYAWGLAMVAGFTLLGFGMFAPKGTIKRFDLHMFFLGVAFALLEVKSLITFSLLFGTTWQVNSMVFFSILASVLCAVTVNKRFKVTKIGRFYVGLFLLLGLNLLVPPETLLFGSGAMRYLVASVLSFAPVFMANVIFSNSFRDTEAADIGFASNLLGIMAGGMLEYFGMLTGYRLLLLPVMLFYALALVLRPRAVELGASVPGAEASLGS